MSSAAYAAALRLELKPSRQRRWWRRLTHLAAFASLPLLQTPGLIALVGAIVVANLYRTRVQPEFTLLWHAEGHWTLFENGRASDARLADAPFVQPWLVILPLRVGDRRRLRLVVVFPDMLPAQEFRRVRVRLRFTRAGGGMADERRHRPDDY